MPEPPKRPEPAPPPKPTASGGVPNNSGSVSSTGAPGNGKPNESVNSSSANTNSNNSNRTPPPKKSFPDPKATKNYWIGAHTKKTVTVTTIDRKFDLLKIASVSYTQTVTKTIKNSGTVGKWFGVYAYEDMAMKIWQMYYFQANLIIRMVLA